jgi:hypothetical protein
MDRFFLGVAPQYVPRWLNKQQACDIVNLYHLARTALAGAPCTRYDRMIWAAREFHKANPDISKTAAYKDLCGLLE